MSEQLNIQTPDQEQAGQVAGAVPANTLPHRGAPAEGQTPGMSAALTRHTAAEQAVHQAREDIAATEAAERYDGLGGEEGDQTPAMKTAHDRLRSAREELGHASRDVSDTAAAERHDGMSD